MSKKKIFLISDSPYATTGLGRMTRYFINMFPEFEWVIWGIHHPTFITTTKGRFAYYSKEDFNKNFRVYSPIAITNGDVFGWQALPQFLKQENPDILITSIDFDRGLNALQIIKELQMTNDMKWINYFPIDRDYYLPEEVEQLRQPDINVVISKFGQEKILEANDKATIHQIYHPIDASEFKVLKKPDIAKFKKEFLKITDPSAFILGTVNRSFNRKDPARTAAVMAMMTQKYQNVYGYFHGNAITQEGIDLTKVAFQYRNRPKSITFLPQSMKEFDGVPQYILNKIYNTIDIFMTASCGEGFGFTTVEAMLTETPIVAPRNTTFPELMEDFGMLVDTHAEAWQINNNTVPWRILDTNEYFEAVEYVKDNYPEFKQKAKKGRKWVLENLSLENIKKQWEPHLA